MTELYGYIIDEYPEINSNEVELILEQSEEIEIIAERCEWISKMIPKIQLSEIRNILLR